MKAVIWTKYGPPEVLQLEELEKPVPQGNEVLIRVHATTVFPGDAEIRRFDVPFWAIWLPMRIFLGILKPKRIKVLGQEVAGEIEAVGEDVKRLKAGDQVIGITGFDFGGYAEYICLSEELTMKKGLVAAKPNNMSYEEAAAVPVGGLNAWHFIRRAKIGDGEKVLINGAGGSIGTFAVQLAKACGAEVTAVDNGAKLEMLRNIGADHVIDYERDDFTRNGETYDVIFDVIDKSPYFRSMKSLNESGRYLLVNTKPSYVLLWLWTKWTSSKKVICELARVTPEDFDSVREFIESGQVKTVVDRSYSLDQIVDAHRYVDTKQKAGNVVIRVC